MFLKSKVENFFLLTLVKKCCIIGVVNYYCMIFEIRFKNGFFNQEPSYAQQGNVFYPNFQQKKHQKFHSFDDSGLKDLYSIFALINLLSAFSGVGFNEQKEKTRQKEPECRFFNFSDYYNDGRQKSKSKYTEYNNENQKRYSQDDNFQNKFDDTPQYKIECGKLKKDKAYFDFVTDLNSMKSVNDYRKLALKYHPDKNRNKDNAAQYVEFFKIIGLKKEYLEAPQSQSL